MFCAGLNTIFLKKVIALVIGYNRAAIKRINEYVLIVGLVNEHKVDRHIRAVERQVQASCYTHYNHAEHNWEAFSAINNTVEKGVFRVVVVFGVSPEAQFTKDIME